MNYKAIDTRRIIDYIYSFPGSVIGVEDIIRVRNLNCVS